MCAPRARRLLGSSRLPGTLANPAGRPDPLQTRSSLARGTLQLRSARRALGQATLGRGLSVLDLVDDPIPSKLPTFSSLTQALPPGRRRPGCLLPAASALDSPASFPRWSGQLGPVGPNIPPAPSPGKLQLTPPPPQYFSPTSLCFLPPSLGFLSFLFILLGQSGVRKSKHKTNLEAGWGGRGSAEARSGAASSPAPCRPAAPGTRRGGQLLYWQALRPDAGPCRPP